MRRLPRGGVAGMLFLSVLLLAGCNNNSNSNLEATTEPPAAPPPPAATSFIEVLHAVPDAPGVNVFVDGDELLADVPYKTASGLVEIDEGEIEVRVEAIVPGGNVDVIDPADVAIPADERLTIIAVGTVGDIEPLILAAPLADLADDQFRIRVVHAAPNAPMVDVFATAPDADLADAAPTGTFEFKGDLGPLELAAGTYRIRVTPAGDRSTVVFDSGDLPVAAGVDIVVAAVQNTGPGAAPINLLLLDGDGALEVLDAATPAVARVIHASPDAPPVDLIADDDFENRGLVGVAFPETTPYIEVPLAFNLKVVPTGQDAPVVIDADVEFVAGFEYSVYAAGLLASIEPLILVDDTRSIATEARVRLVHASPSAGDVDIYVVAAGEPIDDVEPAFGAVPFTADTGYVSLAPGDYDVVVTPAGTKDAAIGPVAITVEAGGVYTAAARDAAGGGTPLGLILMNGFAPQG